MKEGIERIKTLSQDIKDKALIRIIEYLCSREDMNDKYLNEEKSLKQMVKYINHKAGEKRQQSEKMIMVDDEEVFGWAIHYFDETNEALELVEDKDNSWDYRKAQQENTEDKKQEIPKTEPKPKLKKKKEWKSEGQLTLFDFIE